MPAMIYIHTVSPISVFLPGFNQIMGNMSYSTFGCCSASKRLQTTTKIVSINLKFYRLGPYD